MKKTLAILILLTPLFTFSQKVEIVFKKQLKFRNGIAYHKKERFNGKAIAKKDTYGRKIITPYKDGLKHGTVRIRNEITTYRYGYISGYLYRLQNGNEIARFANSNPRRKVVSAKLSIQLEGQIGDTLFYDNSLNKNDSTNLLVGIVVRYKDKSIEFVEASNLDFVSGYLFYGGKSVHGDIKLTDSKLPNSFMSMFPRIKIFDTEYQTVDKQQISLYSKHIYFTYNNNKK